VLGVAAGMREDDYIATGTDPRTRGQRLDLMIAELTEVWQGNGPVPGVGPRPINGDISLWIGGHSPAALRRAAKYGIGWISPGGPPHLYPDLATKIKRLWVEEGRTDTPRMGAMCYVSLGEGGKERADKYLLNYFSYLGKMAGRLAASAITNEMFMAL
jgi:alkanesulfonate monooxygenase SsuD/methylene tetrahydromethanopterin reductase-like flavin-dependent oxidoreductase (luciferase family)